MGAKPILVDTDPNSEHQLVAFRLRLNSLRGELRLTRDEENLRRNGVIGVGIENNAGIGADFDLARLCSGQVDVHVDVREVQHREYLAAGGENLADVGEAILNAPRFRRHERIVGDLHLAADR
jgi:hypothetical protein